MPTFDAQYGVGPLDHFNRSGQPNFIVGNSPEKCRVLVRADTGGGAGPPHPYCKSFGVANVLQDLEFRLSSIRSRNTNQFHRITLTLKCSVVYIGKTTDSAPAGSRTRKADLPPVGPK